MTTKLRKGVLIFLLFGALPESGCSTYEQADMYIPENQKTTMYKIEGNRSRASIQFLPNHQFASAGFVGVPAIPLYVKPGDDRHLAFEFRFTIDSTIPFSVALRSCLRSIEGDEFCASSTSISANVMALATARLPNSAIPSGVQFHTFDFGASYEVVSPTPDQRLTAADLLHHYSYGTYPKDSAVDVTLTYVFDCRVKCPRKVFVDLAGVVDAPDSLVTSGTVLFTNRTLRDYRALAPVQD